MVSWWSAFLEVMSYGMGLINQIFMGSESGVRTA
jgi:hypothetical protein